MSITTKIICPECDKAILADNEIEDETGRCRCAELAKQRLRVDDEKVLETLEGEVGGKICISCQRDVSKEKRYKDRRGKYWCPPCAQRDSARKHLESSGICPDCGREFPDEQLLIFDLTRVCPTCHAARTRDAVKSATRRWLARSFRREERSTIIKLAMVGGILLLIILWSLIHR